MDKAIILFAFVLFVMILSDIKKDSEPSDEQQVGSAQPLHENQPVKEIKFKNLDKLPAALGQLAKDIKRSKNIKVVPVTFTCGANTGRPGASVNLKRVTGFSLEVCDFNGEALFVQDGTSQRVGVSGKKDRAGAIDRLQRANVSAPRDFEKLCRTFMEVEACDISNW